MFSYNDCLSNAVYCHLKYQCIKTDNHFNLLQTVIMTESLSDYNVQMSIDILIAQMFISRSSSRCPICSHYINCFSFGLSNHQKT